MTVRDFSLPHLDGLLMFLAAMRRPPVDRKFLLSYLQKNPFMRDVLLGIGAAFDPYPKCYRQTFFTDDHLAILSDWITVGRDMRSAMKDTDAEFSNAPGAEARARKRA